MQSCKLIFFIGKEVCLAKSFGPTKETIKENKAKLNLFFLETPLDRHLFCRNA